MSDRAPPIYCRRDGSVLRPLDPMAAQAIEALPVGKPITVRLTRTRSLPQHRLYWAMLGLVAENLDQPVDPDTLHDWVKLKVGLRKPVQRRDGKIDWLPDSIAFDKMDQTGFQAFFDKAVTLLVEHLIPGLDRAALTRESQAMLGQEAGRQGVTGPGTRP